MSVRVLTGDCREVLKTLPSESVDCIVTSPPYYGLRDYGVAGQIGLEETPDAYVKELVSIFRDCRRVLKDAGTLWLNLGDCYVSAPPGNKTVNDIDGNYRRKMERQLGHGEDRDAIYAKHKIPGLKQKDLMGMPWAVAFALRADGWWLRQDIIWSKPNPMPESVTDRCTKAHEYLFLLSKSARYFFDAEAVKEAGVLGPHIRDRASNFKKVGSQDDDFGSHDKGAPLIVCDGTRNKRSVWEVATAPFSEAHFATFPPDLIEPCIKAGSPEGGTVLDPFGGAGTTGLVADRFQRNAILIELNPAYATMAQNRISNDAGMFGEVAFA